MESKDENEKDSIMTTKESETYALMVDDFGYWESMNIFSFKI
jgi:hypothetical protein